MMEDKEIEQDIYMKELAKYPDFMAAIQLANGYQQAINFICEKKS